MKANRGWLALAHIPHRGEYFDEYLELTDTRDNRREAARIKRALEAATLNGTFETEFRRRFPKSKRLVRFEAAASDPTLGEFALAWLEERRTQITPASQSHYRLQLKNHLLGFPIASRHVAEITDGDVTQLIAALQEQFADGAWSGTRTINMVIARLRSIFATAKRRKLVAADPMQYVRNLRQPKPDADPFDLGEALALVRASDDWERAFVSVLIFTGMRPNEALALRWSQVDWVHKLICVRQASEKEVGSICRKLRTQSATSRCSNSCATLCRSRELVRSSRANWSSLQRTQR